MKWNKLIEKAFDSPGRSHYWNENKQHDYDYYDDVKRKKEIKGKNENKIK